VKKVNNRHKKLLGETNMCPSSFGAEESTADAFLWLASFAPPKRDVLVRVSVCGELRQDPVGEIRPASGMGTLRFIQ
jgi:hypothetical protein